jgi:hypothetical protein
MVRNIKTALALVALTFAFGLQSSVFAQDSMKHEEKPKLWKLAPFTAKCTRLPAARPSTRKLTESSCSA